MKKIIIFSLVVITMIVVSIYSNRNVYVKADKKKDVVTVKKEKYKYLTIENDNTEELLKDRVEIEEKINYIYEYKNGFIDIDDKTYYYEDDNYVTGMKEIENDIYYFDENGVMQKDIVIDNCYYDEDGKLYTGFKEIDSITYYFTKDGYLTGINEIDNNRYYFDDKGSLIKDGFYEEYYLDENGIIVTGKKEIDGIIYNFDEDGKLLNGFKEIEGKTYFIDENNNYKKGVQLINGTRYYFDFETGELLNKDVKSIIDISSWQGDIDFEKLKESKLVDGVIVRVGYGTTQNDNPVLDNKFKRNISELNRLEIPYGIYIFGYAQNEYAASKEAEFTYNELKNANVNLTYPIFYDAELSTFDGFNYTKSVYKKVINTFINKMNEYGYDDIGLYGNLNMLSNGSLSFSKKYPIWVAQYYKRCEYEKDYVGWQYTSDGSIPGIEGRVDMNIFF